MAIIPKFRAYKFDPVNIKGQILIPVVVETKQSNASNNTFATSADEVSELAKPIFYPTVRFNQWFESVVSLTPKPFEITSTKYDGDWRYSPHTNDEKSYDCAFVKAAPFEEDALDEAQIEGLYQTDDNELSTSNIEIQNKEELTDEEKEVFTSKINKASEYLSGKKIITIINRNSLNQSSISINLFEGETITIGKKDLQDIVGNNASKISKDHFTLHLGGGKIYLKDLSRNGTVVNNTKLEKNQYYNLEENSVINIGGVYLSIKTN